MIRKKEWPWQLLSIFLVTRVTTMKPSRNGFLRKTKRLKNQSQILNDLYLSEIFVIDTI